MFVILIKNLNNPSLAVENLSISSSDTNESNIYGDFDYSKIALEIEKTIDVVSRRPDYAAAWYKLGLLYEQVGDGEQSREAFLKAEKFGYGF